LSAQIIMLDEQAVNRALDNFDLQG